MTIIKMTATLMDIGDANMTGKVFAASAAAPQLSRISGVFLFLRFPATNVIESLFQFCFFAYFTFHLGFNRDFHGRISDGLYSFIPLSLNS